MFLQAGSPLLHALVHPSLLGGHEVLEPLDETGLVLGGWIELEVVNLTSHGVDPPSHGALRRGLRVGLGGKFEHDDGVEAADKSRNRLGRHLVLLHGGDDGHAPAHEPLAAGIQTRESLLQRRRLLESVGEAVDDEPPLGVLRVQRGGVLGESRRVSLLGSLERRLVVVTLGDNREGRRGRRREGADGHGDECRDDVGRDGLARLVRGERDGSELNLARPGRRLGLLGGLPLGRRLRGCVLRGCVLCGCVLRGCILGRGTHGVGPCRILGIQSLLLRRRLRRGDSSLLLRVPRRSLRHGLLDQDVGVYDLQPLRLRDGRHRGGLAGEGHAGHRQADPYADEVWQSRGNLRRREGEHGQVKHRGRQWHVGKQF